MSTTRSITVLKEKMRAKGFMGTREMAEKWGLNESTVRKWIRDGRLRYEVHSGVFFVSAGTPRPAGRRRGPKPQQVIAAPPPRPEGFILWPACGSPGRCFGWLGGVSA